MNKRKLVDYTSMYEALDTLMKTELPEVELYFEIGRAVCARPEKGAAVMAAEHLQASCPESKGFSPRNLRRMREFYRAYADSQGLQALALKLGWTQNVAILEGCEGSQERAWYLRAALEHCWTKAELMEQIQARAWLQEGLDEEYDLIIGMDKANLRNMFRICGGDFNDKMHLLMEYAGRPEQEVADPWYTDDFDTT